MGSTGSVSFTIYPSIVNLWRITKMFFILSHKVGLNLLDPDIVVIECHMHVIPLHAFWIRIEDLVICTNVEISYYSGVFFLLF